MHQIIFFRFEGICKFHDCLIVTYQLNLQTSIGFGSAILENNEYLRQMQTIRFSLSPQNRSERNLGLQWMNLDKETLLSLAKDPKGNGQLKERMKQDSEFRQLVLQLITQAHQGGDEFLFQLSIDSNGNAIIQVFIDIRKFFYTIL